MKFQIRIYSDTTTMQMLICIPYRKSKISLFDLLNKIS